MLCTFNKGNFFEKFLDENIKKESLFEKKYE